MQITFFLINWDFVWSPQVLINRWDDWASFWSHMYVWSDALKHSITWNAKQINSNATIMTFTQKHKTTATRPLTAVALLKGVCAVLAASLALTSDVVGEFKIGGRGCQRKQNPHVRVNWMLGNDV